MGRPWADKQSKEYNLAVVIGRFQPFHYGHIHNIDKGLQIADKVLVLIGSAYNSTSPKNPFTYEQREDMIYNHFSHTLSGSRIYIEPIADNIYEENQWIVDVQEAVEGYANEKIVLIGHEKDDSSYYLKNFQQWKFLETGKWPEEKSSIDATTIRELYYKHDLMYLKGVVPFSTYNFLEAFASTDEYKNVVAEWKFLVDYKNSWSSCPYPPIFTTVDAVVVQSGHILLIERKMFPGKGLFALPGGFIKPNEKLEDAVIRELREETKLKVPPLVLRGSITKRKVFDNPDRSQRGRTITHAYYIQLRSVEELPKVKGSDDAKSAHWIPLSKLYEMDDRMFEDHYFIIRKMIDNE